MKAIFMVEKDAVLRIYGTDSQYNQDKRDLVELKGN
jgi:hypothetical protein